MESHPINNFITEGIVSYDHIDLTKPMYFYNIIGEDTLDNIITNFLNTANINPTQAKFDNNKEDYLNRHGCPFPANDNNFLLYKSILSNINKGNKDNYNLDLLHIIDFNYFEYRPSPNGLKWHMDIGNSINNQRKLSFSFFINDPSEYEGGDLEIWNGNNNHYKLPNNKCSLAIFPSFLLHRVTPVKKGIRKVISGFLGGIPYK